MCRYKSVILLYLRTFLGETRHCTLHGTSIGNDFSLTFDVNEPSMVMSNVKLNVGFEMQLEIGTILEKLVWGS